MYSRAAAHSPCQIEHGLIILIITTGPGLSKALIPVLHLDVVSLQGP